jgi:4-hydroxy-tetrahydrodipicolinate reductase
MVRRLRDHPDLELVGLHCYTADKVGRDAGEIVGIGALGVLATDRIEDIVAAAPDCVNFNGVWPDMDLFRTVLEAGINVVSTADWITGHHRDRNHPLASGQKPTEVIEAACR